jgi:hypothetical protein
MQPCIRIYYSVHWRLNMFRAAYRSSSGALTVFSASGLHTRMVTGRSQVWVGTPTQTWLRPVTTCAFLEIYLCCLYFVTPTPLMGMGKGPHPPLSLSLLLDFRTRFFSGKSYVQNLGAGCLYYSVEQDALPAGCSVRKLRKTFAGSRLTVIRECIPGMVQFRCNFKFMVSCIIIQFL